ncbi:MAG: glutathione S-transferase family protein [Pseudomonadota bacterium]
MDDLILYHCPQTRSQVAYWMNAELGMPAHIEIVDLPAGRHKSPEYLAVNPMGKLPALRHGDVIVTESAAICAYLADLLPEQGLAPQIGTPLRGAYYRWLFFAPSVIEPMMLDRLSKTERQNTSSAGHGSPEDVLTTIRGALSGKEYIVGDTFTAADVVLASTLNFAMLFGAIDKEEVFSTYVGRLLERPAAKSAIG